MSCLWAGLAFSFLPSWIKHHLGGKLKTLGITLELSILQTKWGVWVAQLVKHLPLSSSHDLRVLGWRHEIEPCMGLPPQWRLCLSLSLCPFPHLFALSVFLSLCLPWLNKIDFLKNITGAPGWLSGWASAFDSGHDSGVRGWSPASGSLQGTCFSLCLGLCLSLFFSLSLSFSLSHE